MVLKGKWILYYIVLSCIALRWQSHSRIVASSLFEFNLHYVANFHDLCSGWSPAEVEKLETTIANLQSTETVTRVTPGETNDDLVSDMSDSCGHDTTVIIVRSVSLGPQVLRAETAAITAIAAIMTHQDYCTSKSPS